MGATGFTGSAGASGTTITATSATDATLYPVLVDTIGSPATIKSNSKFMFNGTSGLLSLQQTDATTNTVLDVLRLDRQSSGTPATGIGVGMEFAAETSAGNTEVGAIIEAKTTDVTATSEDFDLIFYTMQNGGTPAGTATESMRLTSAGDLQVGKGVQSWRLNGTSGTNLTIHDSTDTTRLTLSNAGALTVGSLTLTTDLTVANGGTGASTFTTGGVLYGSGASPIAATAAGNTAQMLIGGASAPAWSAIADEVEWEFVSSAYSSAGAALNPVTSAQSLTDYEYKVVFVAVTNAEDNSTPITVRINGRTTDYTWIYSRVKATAADTVTEANTSDTASATYVDTGVDLDATVSGTGTGATTHVRLEMVVTPWDLVNSTFYSMSIRGSGSATFQGSSATASGSSVSMFAGSLSNSTGSTLTSIEITHAIDAGGTDEAAAYLYRRKKGF